VTKPKTTLRGVDTADAQVAAEGPHPSLELLYRHHYPWLLRTVRRRFGFDQAEDLVQETFVRAAAYASGDVRNPRALLIQIATRAAIDRQRRKLARVPLHGHPRLECL
jgi:RNA polymerase sigma-70 factor (ECF subfamily)